MEIHLTEKPKNPIILEGVPGLGLIGTISTEYLIKHLSAKPIGFITSKHLTPMIAVHDAKIVQPLEIYYAKDKNLIIIHAMTDIRGMEWEIVKAIEELYNTLKAKEVISIEGILNKQTNKEMNAYYFSSNPDAAKKLGKVQATSLKEGIIMGVTAVLLLRGKEMKTTGIFVETHTKLPDSRAAAKIIEMLDAYLGLNVDYKPLEEAAATFEKKLQEYLGKMQETAKKQEEKAPYLG